MNKLKVVKNILPIIAEASHKEVLKQVRGQKLISGAELSRLIGLQPSSLVYILRALNEAGWIEVSGTGESTDKGGKRPTLWRISEGFAIFAGIEVFSERLRLSVVDLSGLVYFQEEIVIPSCYSSPEKLTNAIVNVVKAASKRLSVNGSVSIKGLGIGFPGLVNAVERTIKYSSPLGIENFSLGEILDKELHIPVLVTNDANAGVNVSKWYSEVSLSARSIVYLTINQEARNIGAGLILGDNLFVGDNGMAGEIISPLINLQKEMEKLQDDKEAFDVSIKSLAPDATINQLIELKNDKNNLWAEKLLTRFCNNISTEITRIIGLLNPSVIELGGDIANIPEILDQFIIPQVQQRLNKQMHSYFVLPELRVSKFGKFSVSMGATGLALSELFT